MGKPTTKPKEPKNPWDRRVWPTRGTRSLPIIYASVGRALSEWERHEAILSRLFSHFVGADNPSPALRAYNAVRTFEGRADMMRAASEIYFVIWPNASLQNIFKTVLRNAVSFSPRRNDIAHGVVDHFYARRFGQIPPMGTRYPKSYALYPSYANFKDRDVHNFPGYCYTAKELDYFSGEFAGLKPVAFQLTNSLVHNRFGHETLRRRFRAQALAYANQSAQQTDPQE